MNCSLCPWSWRTRRIFHPYLICLWRLWQYSIAFYSLQKKCIVSFGSSRPCGCNHNKISSIHAEQKALNYCRENDKKNKYEIYIWRYSKDGKIKSAYCCNGCTKIINKYGYTNKVYTFDNDNICNAIVDNPQISLGYKIKHNL